MGELLVDLLVTVLFEGVGEAVVGGRRKAGAPSWVARTVVLAVLGLGGGWAWGAHLSEAGRVALPRTFWTALLIGGVAFALLLWRLWQPRWTDSPAVLAPPWEWPAERVLGFLALSLAVAVGVWAGFEPRPLA